jgi:hypothetical protein
LRERGGRAVSESEEQQALLEWAGWQRGKYPELALLFHIPNEGRRTPRTGARLKREGLKAGVPDLFLPVARGGDYGLFIELKAGSNKPTEKQLKWLEALTRQGYCACWCTGWEAAAKRIAEYLQQDGTKNRNAPPKSG